MPVEPSSREHTPIEDMQVDGSGSSRDVFCICRKPEAGMMIECELCHEWYHGKCLKIARGKVKEDDKYTCPICDYRVKIPRDAARPKLEDLQAWQDEIPTLPFQPDEEECLASIVNHAQDFRQFISSYVNPMLSNPDELTTQRFYLRKIEGADILLADETNFFKQELHKWAPVAPEPPPVTSVSLSTRKPRPTKQQKMMCALGISDPADLPEHMRPKQLHPSKRKSSDSFAKQAHLTSASGSGSNTPTALQTPGVGVHSISSDVNLSDMSNRGPAFSFGDMSTTTSLKIDPIFVSSDQYNEVRSFQSPSPRSSMVDPALFTTGPYSQAGQAGSPLANAFMSSSVTAGGGNGQSGAMDTMFADLTNQDESMSGGIDAHTRNNESGMHDDDGRELVAEFLHEDCEEKS